MNLFALLAGLGASLGLWQVQQAAPRRLQDGLLCLASALAGARLEFVLAHPAHFSAHPLEALLLPLGGLGWFGAVLGGLGAAAALAYVRPEPFFPLLDALEGMLLPLGAALWLGCWAAGAWYGPELFAGLPAPDQAGAFVRRFPLQLLAALFLAGWFPASRRGLRRAWRIPGVKACAAWLGLALSLLAGSFLKADPSIPLAGLRLDTWEAFALLAFSAAGLLSCIIRGRNQPGKE